jgi:cyclohexa-1,5-dienecarbonyl-CoA hydratase
MTATDALVRLETTGAVARITLARPPLNILTAAMLDALTGLVQAAAAQPQVKVVLLTGAGERAFCAGVDVADHTPDRVAGMIEAFGRAVQALLALELPVVAALNGPALGGGFELALACDVVIARDDATVGLPEVRLGAFPPAAAALLPRLVGRQRALDLILSGRSLKAAEAHRMGLVTAVTPADQFTSAVDAYVDMLAQLSAPVLRLAKRAVTAGLEQPLDDALRGADRLYLDELMQLRDAQEGLAAFMEKRRPEWIDA